jgi:hypothetical protein
MSATPHARCPTSPRCMRLTRAQIGVTLLLLLLVLPVGAAQFVPYTDGRKGGCFITARGHMFGCTPQPPSQDELRLREELKHTRQERDALLRERQAEEARRAYEAAREQARVNAEIEAYNREVDAHNARVQKAKGARDVERHEALSRKSESCREKLARIGYKVVGAGACKTEDGTYVTCPAC